MSNKNIKSISEYFWLKKDDLEKYWVLDRFIWLDTELFIDPFLLDTLDIPEFKDSEKKIKERFRKIIKLLSLSKVIWDMPFMSASKLIECPETKWVWIWYSQWSDDGNSIWPILAKQIVTTWKEIIDLWFDDVEIFELIGLFQKNFWEDRLSDLCIHTLTTEFFSYTARITEELSIAETTEVTLGSDKFILPYVKEQKKYILFVPKKSLRSIQTWLDKWNIEHVSTFNTNLKNRLNQLVWDEWKEYMGIKDNRKKEFFKEPSAIQDLLKHYNQKAKQHYNYDLDPKWEMQWRERWLSIADGNPIELSLSWSPDLNEVISIVNKIILQFKKTIEHNGANELLIKWNGRYSEKFAQKVFFTVADSYCSANNLDISPESEASTWPVDFKFSNGLKKVVVEIKLTTNDIKKGVLQLEEYEKWEWAYWIYLILQVWEHDPKINKFYDYEKDCEDSNSYFPDYHIVDARIKPTPSNLSLPV